MRHQFDNKDIVFDKVCQKELAVQVQPKSVLEAFTGNSEAILDAKDQNTLKKMIHKVSVRASEFQSHSKQSVDEITTPEDDSASIVKDVVLEMQEEASVSDGDDWGKW